MTYILAIDQGTTSSRAIAFDEGLRPVHAAQKEFRQHYPKSGWVEHDPADLWQTVLATCQEVVDEVGAGEIAAIGITNQRETTLVWNRRTGAPIHPAIVWQDRRTAAFCAEMRDEADFVAERTGLVLDPYFSGTKLRWLLDHVEGARAQAEAGELLFGTVDTWLIWNLTEGRVHGTDATNACRTMLYNLVDGTWDEEVCGRLDIPVGLLPEIRDSAGAFGATTVFGPEIPILGVAGDQQAATVGQACFEKGMLKSTYGTGCFALLNVGDAPVISQNRLLGTVAYQLEGKRTYALEGAIFIAGAVVQWLRDGLGIIDDAPQSQDLAEAADPSQRLYLVPAFTGLGAPHWDPNARGAIFGLTRNSGPAEFARAALESVGYQTRDLLDAMRADVPTLGDTVLRVDGGMSASDWSMQFLADILGAPVDRPVIQETTALGAAWLAGSQAGICADREAFARSWALDRRFEATMDDEARETLYTGWTDAVRRTLT
jgi:glycerol kinase